MPKVKFMNQGDNIYTITDQQLKEIQDAGLYVEVVDFDKKPDVLKEKVKMTEG